MILDNQKQIERQLAEKGESMSLVDRPSMRAIIQYSEGSHIGDTDIMRSTKTIGSITRDMYAFTGNTDCILFQMNYKEIMKIKDMFEPEWEELMKLAIRRQKNHEILIKKEVRRYTVEHIVEDVSDSSLNSSSDNFSDHFYSESSDSSTKKA